MTISSEADAIAAMRQIHDKGPSIVVISSSNLGRPGYLLMFASRRTGAFPISSRYVMY